MTTSKEGLKAQNKHKKVTSVVTLFPSKSKPIFITGQYEKEFYVRWTASTKQYVDIEEIVNYCLEHWNRKI